MTHCDLCGSDSDRLTHVEDLWGLGVSTMCADAEECASAWGTSFGQDPGETAVLSYAITFSDLDKAPPPTVKTRRIAR